MKKKIKATRDYFLLFLRLSIRHIFYQTKNSCDSPFWNLSDKNNYSRTEFVLF
jgi:hypothetical protein